MLRAVGKGGRSARRQARGVCGICVPSFAYVGSGVMRASGMPYGGEDTRMGKRRLGRFAALYITAASTYSPEATAKCRWWYNEVKLMYNSRFAAIIP